VGADEAADASRKAIGGPRARLPHRCSRRTNIVGSVDEDRWELWRQDDNGNRYRMKTFNDRLTALAEALVFTGRGHRQSGRMEEKTRCG